MTDDWSPDGQTGTSAAHGIGVGMTDDWSPDGQTGTSAAHGNGDVCRARNLRELKVPNQTCAKPAPSRLSFFGIDPNLSLGYLPP